MRKRKKHNKRMSKGHKSIQKIGKPRTPTSNEESISSESCSVDCTVFQNTVDILTAIIEDAPAALILAQEDLDECEAACESES